MKASFLRLRQRTSKHRGGDAIKLGVELDRSDELTRAGHLEVHVTEGVLRAQDVGQRCVTRLTINGVRHETHGDTRHRSLERHTCLEERQR